MYPVFRLKFWRNVIIASMSFFLALFLAYLVNLGYRIVIELAREAVRTYMGAVAYAGGWVMAVTLIFSAMPTSCTRSIGGIFDKHPERLSIPGFTRYQECLGRQDGLENYKINGGYQVVIALLVLYVAYKVLPPVLTRLAYCVLGKDYDEALDKARKTGIDSVEADLKPVVDGLQLEIKRLESEAAFCKQAHDSKYYLEAQELRSYVNNRKHDAESSRFQFDMMRQSHQALLERNEHLERSDVAGLRSQLALQEFSQPCRDAEHSNQVAHVARLEKELEEARSAAQVEATKHDVERADERAVLKFQLEVAQGALKDETRKHQEEIQSFVKNLAEANTSKDLAETALRAWESSKVATVPEAPAADLGTEVMELRAQVQTCGQLAEQSATELNELREFKESAVKEGQSLQAQLKDLMTYGESRSEDWRAQDALFRSEIVALRQALETASAQLRDQEDKHRRDLGDVVVKMASEKEKMEAESGDRWRQLNQTATQKIHSLEVDLKKTIEEHRDATKKSEELVIQNWELKRRVEALRAAMPTATAEKILTDPAVLEPTLSNREWSWEELMADSSDDEPEDEGKKLLAEGLDVELEHDKKLKDRPLARPRGMNFDQSVSGGGGRAPGSRNRVLLGYGEKEKARVGKRGAPVDEGDPNPHVSKRGAARSSSQVDTAGGFEAQHHDADQAQTDLDMAKIMMMGRDTFE